MDYGHSEADRLLRLLERRLNKEYNQASKEVHSKLVGYFKKFEKKDAIKRAERDAGKITKYVEDYAKMKGIEEINQKTINDAYDYWRTGQIAVGERWKEMQETLAEDFHNVNNIASGMIKDHSHDVYALNHNYGTFEVERGSLVDTSYTLYDKSTVERLVRDNPDLLPPPGKKVSQRIREGKDVLWNKQLIQSSMTQSILQGESIPQIAKRLAESVGDSNRKAAIRNARTMTTGAENAGRVDSYKRAQKMGIDMVQVWLATLDGRTRHSHRVMDGEKVQVGKKFSNDCRFPGDPQGPSWEVYNCRCTLIGQVDGVDFNLSDASQRNNKLGGMNYEEWKKGHEKISPVSIPPATPVRRFQSIRGPLGDDFVDGMETVLNFTGEEDIKDLFYKYDEELKVIDTNLRGGAFFRPSDGGIHINASKVSKGDDLHLPYQTTFHEFGHNIDWLANGRDSFDFISNSYHNGELIKTIKQDWKNFKWKAFVDNKSYGDERYLRTVLRSMDTKKGVLKDLTRQHRNGEITTTEMLSRLTETQRNKLMIEIGFYDSDVIKLLSQEKMGISTCGNISDIIEGCTHISYPLGVGHGKAYHDSTSTAKEFFAEVIDSKATNPKSLAQMRRIFPNAVKVVEKIIQEVI